MSDATASDPGRPLRVMLVDDQHLLRMGFRLILEGEDDFEVTAEASDGLEALEVMESLGEKTPDVVLMDVRMPRMDGIEATRRIVEKWCDIRVIILTTFDLDEYAFAGLQAGASAFLLKDVKPAELTHAVRVVASGDAVVAPRITQRLLEVYMRDASAPGLPAQAPVVQGRRGTGRAPAAPGAGAAGTGSGPAGSETPGSVGNDSALPSGEHVARALHDGIVREALTARETEVLFAVAEGLSNAEIAARFVVSEATVKTHVRRILTKLQLRDRVQAVVYVYHSGLAG